MELVLVVLICLGTGAGLGWLAARSRGAAETARLTATLAATQAGEQRLEQSLRSLSHDLSQTTAREQNHTFNQLVAPLQETLGRYEKRVSELERQRLDAYAELRTQVQGARETSEQLRTETSQLLAALRAPQVRGRWGEHQLRRIVEAAGMLEHCDFTEQAQGTTERGGVRPDMVVRLAGDKNVVVDAKVPCDAFLEASAAGDDAIRRSRLAQHAKHLRGHVDALSGKAYWQAFEPSPEFVVLFVPADAFLDGALQADPTLLEHAFARNVVLATPATLIALLRTIAYAWRQEALARNAAEVHSMARELYSRLATMGGHIGKVGTALGSAVTSYNRAVGSLESRVLVTARRFAEMGVSDDEITTPAQVELAPRQLQAPELVASEQHTLVALNAS